MAHEEKSGICRVCLSTLNKKSMSLFQEYKNYAIYSHINAITNIEIKENDGLPDKICSSCLLDLETAVNFKQKCESSNIILQSTTFGQQSTETSGLLDEKIVVKKEEKEDVPVQLLEDSTFYDDNFFDIEDQKPLLRALNKVELGLKKSRAIDLNLQCHDCGEYFKSKCKLRVHWKKVHLKEALFCHNCKRSFKSFKAFNRHKIEKRKSCVAASNFRIEGEGKVRTFYCRECEYKSCRIKDMITHWVIHTGDRPYKCDLCPKTCTQQSSLQAHKESAHKQFKFEIACHVCGKLLRGRNRIYRHLKIHTDTGIHCPVCQKILKNKASLAQHMQRHTGVKSYTCEKCAGTFFTASELYNHKRTVHDKGKYWYYCNICDYKAIRGETIKRHKARHTSSNVPCTVCGMFFDNTEKLVVHQRRHFEEKKYECPHCEMKFFRRDSVGKHVRAKHRCRMAINQKSLNLSVKEERVEKQVVNKYDDIFEVNLSSEKSS